MLKFAAARGVTRLSNGEAGIIAVCAEGASVALAAPMYHCPDTQKNNGFVNSVLLEEGGLPSDVSQFQCTCARIFCGANLFFGA